MASILRLLLYLAIEIFTPCAKYLGGQEISASTAKNHEKPHENYEKSGVSALPEKFESETISEELTEASIPDTEAFSLPLTHITNSDFSDEADEIYSDDDDETNEISSSNDEINSDDDEARYYYNLNGEEKIYKEPVECFA
ncbi:hypothetical protein Glove_54g11 [Diversispora epigaea]|uniref:Uncharacterized protein n=1 Tax=Diversispora epigaea TaxID=1348612 RepID=A0A397JCM3_9GLOM|nr:hypothetical protein Glove_54g11 [Diversispora epigaea]